MSYASDKGYAAEHCIGDYLTRMGHVVHRPRTTSHRDSDVGDLIGLPFPISVKNHHRLDLASWCDELEQMTRRASAETGIVVHKRRARADGGSYYVTTPMWLMLPFIDAYVDIRGNDPRPVTR